MSVRKIRAWERKERKGGMKAAAYFSIDSLAAKKGPFSFVPLDAEKNCSILAFSQELSLRSTANLQKLSLNFGLT